MSSPPKIEALTNSVLMPPGKVRRPEEMRDVPLPPLEFGVALQPSLQDVVDVGFAEPAL
jgi:hypothetical protein